MVVIILKSKHTFIKFCIYFQDQAAIFLIQPRIKTSENSSFCISGIIKPIERKFDVHLRRTRPFLLSHHIRSM